MLIQVTESELCELQTNQTFDQSRKVGNNLPIQHRTTVPTNKCIQLYLHMTYLNNQIKAVVAC